MGWARTRSPGHQGLLEASRLELLSAQFPVELRSLRVSIGFVPSLNEQLVVELVQTPRPAGVALEGLSCAIVVVDDVDVPVRVLPFGVVVDDHEVLGAERGLSEANAQNEHVLEVLRPVRVEDLGAPASTRLYVSYLRPWAAAISSAKAMNSSGEPIDDA